MIVNTNTEYLYVLGSGTNTALVTATIKEASTEQIPADELDGYRLDLLRVAKLLNGQAAVSKRRSGTKALLRELARAARVEADRIALVLGRENY